MPDSKELRRHVLSVTDHIEPMSQNDDRQMINPIRISWPIVLDTSMHSPQDIAYLIKART